MYLEKLNCNTPCVALDDMILTTDTKTTAGSKMLANYTSLFEAEVVTKLKNAGYGIAGKINVGEFGIDFLGETSHFGACDKDGKLVGATACVMPDVNAVVGLDVNGAERRGAVLNDLTNLKPTYGTVSRFGTIPVVCSGETVSITGKCPNCVEKVLKVVIGHDDKDGTSHRVEDFAKLDTAKEIKKVCCVKAVLDKTDSKMQEKIQETIAKMQEKGVDVEVIDGKELLLAKPAWNALMCAELCNNVSRYDGIKFGHRAKGYKNIDELYTFSRTEGFGELLKTAILYGSECLATENYMKVYDKALRIRRVIVEYFAKLFDSFDAVIMPAVSKTEYTVDSAKEKAFVENVFTAPASITGLPAVTTKGVQIVGSAFSDYRLLDFAKKIM